jgi:hypothetical protein
VPSLDEHARSEVTPSALGEVDGVADIRAEQAAAQLRDMTQEPPSDEVTDEDDT